MESVIWDKQINDMHFRSRALTNIEENHVIYSINASAIEIVCLHNQRHSWIVFLFGFALYPA